MTTKTDLETKTHGTTGSTSDPGSESRPAADAMHTRFVHIAQQVVLGIRHRHMRCAAR